jgi:hypothetical protein
MLHNYLHNHKDFADLIRIVGQEKSIDPTLVEKDYWIMHCLFGLQQLGLNFQLKGGTSLSKGFSVIDRFSEDIDIMIEPPKTMQVKTKSNDDKEADRESRKQYYDWLAKNITIAGIKEIERDHIFDDVPKYRSGGIRLYYNSVMPSMFDIKDGILLEVGFDDITPNEPITISSWAYDYAKSKIDLVDNRAIEVPCYHYGYTLVEKLQTISTKFRKQQKDGSFPANFMRHYYDVYCLLREPKVQLFIGIPEYKNHKAKRFRSGDNPIISENEAFLLNDKATRKIYADAYQGKSKLYYSKQPEFEDIIELIQKYVPLL